MARRYKSLAHGIKDADPYNPYHSKVSPYHREHRSKKGRAMKYTYDATIAYKKKVEELKLKELENEKRRITGN